MEISEDMEIRESDYDLFLLGLKNGDILRMGVVILWKNCNFVNEYIME